MKITRLSATAFAAAVLALGMASASAADPVKLTVAIIPSDSAAEAYYAQDLGYFKDAGLDVTILPMQASPPIISAVVGGSVDIGNSVVGSAVAARAHGVPVKFLAPGGLYLAATPTARLVALAGSPLKAPKDFVGKTIAVSGLQDLVFWAARAWISDGKVNPDDVKYVELPFPEMVAALQQHRVDGAVLIEPFVAGAGDNVSYVADIDDWVSKRFLATGWLASESWLAAHPDVAQKFMAVMRRTADWANAHHKESGDILLKYVKLTPELAGKMIRPTYGTTLDPKDMQPVIDNSQKYTTMPRAVTAGELTWAAPK
jgi:NitT/TauT family transport system substrate-binding protein